MFILLNIWLWSLEYFVIYFIYRKILIIFIYFHIQLLQSIKTCWTWFYCLLYLLVLTYQLFFLYILLFNRELHTLLFTHFFVVILSPIQYILASAFLLSTPPSCSVTSSFPLILPISIASFRKEQPSRNNNLFLKLWELF